MLLCQINESIQFFLRIHCSCRVIWIANDDCLGLIGYFCLDVFFCRKTKSILYLSLKRNEF